MKYTIDQQLAIIKKGAAEIVSEDELRKKLLKSAAENKPLVIKLGLDPTAPDIHLGHAVVLRKIKQMQDLGHQAVIIIGDFTGKIGDPSGRSKGRNQLSEEQVKQNAKTYVAQLTQILDPEKTAVRFNSEWLSQLDFSDTLALAQTISVARMLERDDFARRYQNQIPIGLHEFFYPLMQAYDSLAIEADIEIGGTDQTFNLLMGRHLQKHFNKEKQVTIFMPLLEGLDGVEKMSKSLGNYIGVAEAPFVMFKKVMEVPDSLLLKYFLLATDLLPSEITALQKRLETGENPRDIKLILATEITGLYHGKDVALQAKQEFITVFQRDGIPETMPEVSLGEISSLTGLASLLVEAGELTSRSAFRRLVEQGGVQLNGAKLSIALFEETQVTRGDIIRLGKKRFIRLI
ncbi:tyrosine--tRNA ligase [Candidatus Enterococcus leclercqii]|uniref:tyrosine--tRNA ligase n=1 Tax=Candidatus Enterococcus leclercqii TaxID=1857218 RepID=UPI001379B6AD|nr:tyrosine--tRNA ligase [Enterococcus sp. CU9D]KAF1290867.1 tyrosine--tRNA ligase [Enterococcus sp. CU9D]